MKKINTEALTEADKLKMRVLALKPFPPLWRIEFLKEYPEYDNRIGLTALSNCASLRSMDEPTVLKMEAFMGKVKSKKSKQNA